jgi:hypothetical protein
MVSFWNDHREVFNKIVTLFQYYLSGQVNVRVTQYIGNAGLIIIIASLYMMYRPGSSKIMLFAPAVFLFFQTGYAENSFYGMASLTNFYVMSFGYLSVLLLLEKGHSWIWSSAAFLLSAAAYFTQANGILFLFTGLIILLYGKDWEKSAAWFILSIPVIIFYRCYTGDPYHWDISKIHTGGLSGFNLLYFFSFIGNCFGASSMGYISEKGGGLVTAVSRILPLAAGTIIMLYFIFITLIRYYRKNPALYAVFLFLILSAFGAAIVRGNDFGVLQSLTSRYRVLSVQFIMLIYLSVSELLKSYKWSRIFFIVSLAASIMFCSFVYYLKFEPVRRHRQDLIISLENWEKTGKGLFPLAYQWNESADAVLTEAVKRRIYCIPDYKE